jgi:hypothetical protein
MGSIGETLLDHKMHLIGMVACGCPFLEIPFRGLLEKVYCDFFWELEQPRPRILKLWETFAGF